MRDGALQAIMSMSGWEDIATTLADSGAIMDGSSAKAHPVANAGATLEPIWWSGQFHGAMSPHTPIGSRSTSVVAIRSSNAKSVRRVS